MQMIVDEPVFLMVLREDGLPGLEMQMLVESWHLNGQATDAGAGGVIQNHKDGLLGHKEPLLVC